MCDFWPGRSHPLQERLMRASLVRSPTLPDRAWASDEGVSVTQPHTAPHCPTLPEERGYLLRLCYAFAASHPSNEEDSPWDYHANAHHTWDYHANAHHTWDKHAIAHYTCNMKPPGAHQQDAERVALRQRRSRSLRGASRPPHSADATQPVAVSERRGSCQHLRTLGKRGEVCPKAPEAAHIPGVFLLPLLNSQNIFIASTLPRARLSTTWRCERQCGRSCGAPKTCQRSTDERRGSSRNLSGGFNISPKVPEVWSTPMEIDGRRICVDLLGSPGIGLMEIARQCGAGYGFLWAVRAAGPTNSLQEGMCKHACTEHAMQLPCRTSHMRKHLHMPRHAMPHRAMPRDATPRRTMQHNAT
eukprot:366223-Chlamydomonas_euryale.AAC.8